jgi:hypothetical protein
MPPHEVMAMLALGCERPRYLEDYFVYLETLLRRKPSSLYTYVGVRRLLLILPSASNLTLRLYQYLKSTVGWAGSHNNVDRNDAFETLRTLARKYKGRMKHALASSTLEDKVQNHEMPPGGLEQVEWEVMQDYERLIAVDLRTLLTTAAKKEFYLRFLAVLMTALCVRVSQGRMKVVELYTILPTLI